MKNKYIRFLIFLASNFLALGIGILLMKNGPRSDWYLALNKAPWTPPGFMFGLSWSIIMVLFAIYMTKLSFQFPLFDWKLIKIYMYQWILNVGWNYEFFNQKNFLSGLLFLLLLLGILILLAITNRNSVKKYTGFILPYIIWMCIAVSLNAYVLLYN